MGDRKTDWMQQGTDLFLGAVDNLTDAEFAGPSGLPGWTRAHLVAHLHFNALALGRLVSWAATGEEQRMYPSREHRDAEINEGATRPPAELRELVRASATSLISQYHELTPTALIATVVTAQGRPVPAADIAWMRARETAIHTVDLATSYSWADLPTDLTAALAADALEYHAGTPQLPDLTAYLTGRSAQAPTLSDWL